MLARRFDPDLVAVLDRGLAVEQLLHLGSPPALRRFVAVRPGGFLRTRSDEHEQLCQILWHCLVRVVGSAMVDLAGRVPPGQVYRPYEYQSLLTSDQVSGFVHVPMQETPGFGVRTRARFGLVPVTVAARDSVPIGPVVARTAVPPAGPAPRVTRGRHGHAVPIMGDGRHS